MCCNKTSCSLDDKRYKISHFGHSTELPGGWMLPIVPNYLISFEVKPSPLIYIRLAISWFLAPQFATHKDIHLPANVLKNARSMGLSISTQDNIRLENYSLWYKGFVLSLCSSAYRSTTRNVWIFQFTTQRLIQVGTVSLSLMRSFLEAEECGD